MSYNIFLDDERYPKQVTWIKLPSVEWRIVRSYRQFVRTIERLGMPDIISFDHDLGVYPEVPDSNGNHCLVWLIDRCAVNGLDLPSCYFHSMNMERRKSMEFCYVNYIMER